MNIFIMNHHQCHASENVFSNVNAKNSFMQTQQVHLWCWWRRQIAGAQGDVKLSPKHRASWISKLKDLREREGVAVKCRVANTWSDFLFIISLLLSLTKLDLFGGGGGAECDNNWEKKMTLWKSRKSAAGEFSAGATVEIPHKNDGWQLPYGRTRVI